MQEALERLQEVERLRLQGKLDKAESLGTALVRKYPYYLAGLHTLGLVYLDKNIPERALDCLVRALMCDARNAKTLAALGLVYQRLGALELSQDCLIKAQQIAPDDASVLASLGETLRANREDDAAIDIYRRALAIDPSLETAEIGLTSCLLNRGRLLDAAAVLDRSVARGQRSLKILGLLASLPPRLSKFVALDELDKLQPSIEKAGASTASDFAFAYSAALDQAGMYAKAWQHLVDANRTVHEACARVLPAEVAARDAALKRIANADSVIAAPDPRYPISLFILGPSRSGKTTLENLLRNFDCVKAGGENQIVETALRKTWQSAGFPASHAIDQLPSQLWPDFRSRYLEELREKSGDASVFTLTVGERIADISILARIVPNVRILLVRRDSNDNVLRIFMARYAGGNSHAYSLPSIRAYLDWYSGMQDRVGKTFEAIANSVRYEDVVADAAKALSGAAALCGIQATPADNLSVYDDRGCSRNYLALMECA